MPEQTIHLHRQAPPKPPEGEACNGCGVCCALETCPVARLRFLQKKGPCPALRWVDTAGRYHCALLTQPALYFPGLRGRLEKMAEKLMRRWIAAGQGCDCSAQPEETARMP